jgi:light-regulated signal transduction histidine kinase (bacteriophytochrome)
MRVSFPVRQMLRLMSDSISRNVERLSLAQRLLTRKMVRHTTLPFTFWRLRNLTYATLLRSQFNTITSGETQQPQGYIVSNADDLLGLFDADFGVLVIGEGAKILGPNEHGQEVLVVAEYLRLKHFVTIQVSQAVTKDFPDLQLSTGLEVIAGLLYVPLSQGGTDFIALLRKGQPRAVRWAGKPDKGREDGRRTSLEPRASFKVWSETVAGRCRMWSDEQLEMAGVLALVYGKVRSRHWTRLIRVHHDF